VAEVEVSPGVSSVTVSPGDRLVFRLPENPTTGYRWDIATLPEPLALSSSEFTPSPDPRPGAGGERIIHVSATKPGRGEVRIRLLRSWEPDAPIEELRVTVDVTAS
jgi:inhibitor of cysteine peptidase